MVYFSVIETDTATSGPVGELGKGKREDAYLEVRKRRGHIFLE
jgi:hypothetical protein